MPKPACIPCGRFYRPHKNGARLMECMPKPGVQRAVPGQPEGWTDYKLWMGDLWQCQGCGNRIAVGYGVRPLSEHHEETFERETERATELMGGALPRLYDC